MAELPYEEERKRQSQMPVYENSAPVGTYYGEQGNAQSDMAEEILRRAAEQADPQRQAEEDARIQRGRNFWTGANLFANVVANAINVNGTAKGAPNMTWNDAASQKMYDTWRTADQQLKADRKAAQQRFDALRMQDASMRAKGAEQRAAERQRAADMNFNIGLEQARYDRNKADEQEKWERNQQAAREAADLAYERQKELARMRHPGGGGKSGSSGTDGIIISLGSAEIPAKDDNEAKKIRRDIARRLIDKENAAIEERNKGKKPTEEKEKSIDYPKNDKEAGDIIYMLGDYYDNDDDFRDWANTTYGIDDIYSEDAPAAQPAPAPAAQGPTQPLYIRQAERAKAEQERRTAQQPTRPATQADTGNATAAGQPVNGQYAGQWRRRPSAIENPMQAEPDTTTYVRPIIPKKKEEDPNDFFKN